MIRAEVVQKVAMPETGDPQPQAQMPAARHYKPSSIREWRCIGRENWQTRSAAMGKFCSGNQTILMRCIYSASLLVKHGKQSGELN